jgi:hypothetical protein
MQTKSENSPKQLTEIDLDTSLMCDLHTAKKEKASGHATGRRIKQIHYTANRRAQKRRQEKAESYSSSTNKPGNSTGETCDCHVCVTTFFSGFSTDLSFISVFCTSKFNSVRKFQH